MTIQIPEGSIDGVRMYPAALLPVMWCTCPYLKCNLSRNLEYDKDSNARRFCRYGCSPECSLTMLRRQVKKIPEGRVPIILWPDSHAMSMRIAGIDKNHDSEVWNLCVHEDTDVWGRNTHVEEDK